MVKHIGRYLLVVLLGAATQVHAAAQPDPGAVQRLDQDRLERFRQEQQLQKGTSGAPEITVPGRGEVQAGLSEVRNIPVSAFEVDRSEILSQDEITNALAPYQGRTLSLKELFEAVDALNKLYDEKGIRTARAILPPQEVKDGVVRIRLIEARLGEIKFSSLGGLRPEFIGDRIRLRPGELLSVTRLEEDLIRFNKLYESKLRASITAGAAVGTTDINIEVLAPPRFQLIAFADNAGHDSLGENRLGAIFKGTNLLGVSDSLQLVTTDSEGSRNYAVSYSVPISRFDTRLDIAYNYGTIALVNGPFVPLDITGRSRDVSLGLTQPFAVGRERQWAAYARLSARNSISEFGGFTQQDVDLRVLALGVSGEAHYADSAWYVDSSLNFGLTQLGGEARFSYYRANAMRIDRIADRIQLVSRVGGQYAFDEVIPSGEQFQVGGLYTVRGYSEGLLSGRNGYFGGLELRYALNQPAVFTEFAPQWQALVFLDHGAAFPYRPGEGHRKEDFLTSAGAGLMLDLGSRVAARVALAYPLTDNPAEFDRRSPRIHAGINISWF